MIDALESLNDTIVTMVTQAIHGMAAFLPQLITATLLIIAGWLVARVVRALVNRLAGGIDRVSGAIGLNRALGTARMRASVAGIVGTLAYWIVILLFTTFATNVLGLGLFARWLDQIVSYLFLKGNHNL